MSISSILFLFGVLPVFLILFYVSKAELRIYEMLLFSILFFSLNDKQSLYVFLSVIIITYLISLGIDKINRKAAKVLLISGIIGNVGVLVFYKYIGFISEIIGKEISFKPNNMMVGVSFTVFAMISYLVDVYQKKVTAPRNPAVFICYSTMFPKVVSGPIVRYSDCSPDFEAHFITSTDIGIGAKKFMEGFIKKILIADNLYLLINELNATIDVHRNATITSLWIGSIAFSLQLYFDFSGYSDMAIGLSRMLGFHFKENFNHPYICNGFTDFWRRWHISLSEWFRDYIYIPLGGSRKSTVRNIINLLIVWLLTGIWHGAGFNFIFWGLVFFVMLIFERYVIKVKQLESVPALLWRIFTLVVINFNWVIFSHGTLKEGVQYCLGMIGYYGNDFVAKTDIRLVREYGIFLFLGVFFSMPISYFIQKKSENKTMFGTIISIVTPIVYGIMFLWAISYALLGYHNPFMYQQF